MGVGKRHGALNPISDEMDFETTTGFSFFFLHCL